MMTVLIRNTIRNPAILSREITDTIADTINP